MAKKNFICTLKVRGYELDGYGHVKHAVYLNYFEYARWCMIEEVGCGANYFKDHGLSPVIVRAEVDYRAPCFLAENLKIETRLYELRSRVAVFEQTIYKENGMIAAYGKLTLVGVGENGKAQNLPQDFKDYFGDPVK